MPGCRRALPLLLAACLLSACASAPSPIAPEIRQQLGKVYLVSSQHKPETYIDAGLETGGVAGALKGAGQGAGRGVEQCLSSALGSMQLAPVVMVVCSVLVVPASIVSGTVSGGQAGASPEAQAATRDRINQALQDADFSLALAKMIDEAGQRRSALAPYEMAHGILPPLGEDESVYAQARQWDYQTVMEIEVLEAGLEEASGRTPMLQWSMVVQLTLVDAATGKVRARQQYTHSSTPQPSRYWLEEDYATLTRAIVESNKALTEQIVGNVFIN